MPLASPSFSTKKSVKTHSYSNAVNPPSVPSMEAAPLSSEHRARDATFVQVDPKDVKDPYVWNFEAYSQANYYGECQRFNGDGCVNTRCSAVQAYKGLPNKEYIFYDGDSCFGTVILCTKDEKMQGISQPFAPCSIRVQWPFNYQNAGNPPNDADLAVYPEPWYKGKSSVTLKGKNQCHILGSQGVMSYQGLEDTTYTLYKDPNCSGTVLEKNQGPDSRTDTYMISRSVMIH